MTDHYDRDGNPAPDDWYDKEKHGHMGRYWSNPRRVARTVVGDITVSTSWLGLDHDFLTGRPIIFETMTFGEPWNYELTRYSTEEQAMRGHLDTLDRLRAGRPPFSHLDAEGDQ